MQLQIIRWCSDETNGNIFVEVSELLCLICGRDESSERLLGYDHFQFSRSNSCFQLISVIRDILLTNITLILI